MTHRSPAVLLCGLSLVALAACTAGDSGDAAEEPTSLRPAPRVALLIPGSDTASMTAPDTFQVTFETSKGDFVVEVHRDWSPRGADRFYYLVRNGFYDGVKFYRVLDMLAQFGLSGDPKLSHVWEGPEGKRILDDSVAQSNMRGFITFAMWGLDTRSTQVFINSKDNPHLDERGFAPFGKVVTGMEVIDQLYDGYGEVAPWGEGPLPRHIQRRGDAYLTSEFPELDYVIRAAVIEQ